MMRALENTCWMVRGRTWRSIAGWSRIPSSRPGNLSTRFIDEHFKPGALAPSRETTEVAVLAAALHAREERLRVDAARGRACQRRAIGWRWAIAARAREGAAMKFWVTLEDREAEVEFRTEGERLLLEVDGRRLEADFHRLPDGEVYSLLVDGRSHEVRVSPGAGRARGDGARHDRVPVEVRHPLEKMLERDAARGRRPAAKRSPRPCRASWSRCACKRGRRRSRPGQAVVVVEAMKMQNELVAPRTAAS